jgi:hypothetical protein
LAVRSKKVSKFGHPLLQVGEALDEIGHAWVLETRVGG